MHDDNFSTYFIIYECDKFMRLKPRSRPLFHDYKFETSYSLTFLCNKVKFKISLEIIYTKFIILDWKNNKIILGCTLSEFHEFHHQVSEQHLT